MIKVNGNKKRHGSFYFHPSLTSGSRIAHISRISNAVSPRQAILYMQVWAIHYKYSTHCDINHPRRRFVALPLWEVSKLRSLNTQNSNVRKRLSRPALQAVWWSQSINVLIHKPTTELTESLQKKVCKNICFSVTSAILLVNQTFTSGR